MSSLTYRKAGVDVHAAAEFVARIRPLAGSTHTGDVVTPPSGFAGLIRLPAGTGTETPLLAATCDGVGTKLLVARAMGEYEGLGRDLVAMSVNDLAAAGSRPLLFLDYLATARLDLAQLESIVRGVAAACCDVGCVLLGGETAEMPDVYADGGLDLAGFAVGIVEGNALPDPSTMRSGDIVVALPSSGLHANGFSLTRRILLERSELDLEAFLPELGRTLGAELLRPTALYVEPALGLMGDVSVRAAAHVTGGGLLGRAGAMLPGGLSMVIAPDTYPRPPIIELIRTLGDLSWEETAATFNMGLGFLVVVAPQDAPTAEERGWLRVGELVAGDGKVDLGYTTG